LIAAFFMLAANSTFGAAGKFLIVVGDVDVVDRDGGARSVKRGSPISSGETVRTAGNGFAQLRMADRSLFAVRADTEFTLERFKWDGPKEKKGSVALSLLRGALRSITGLIGKADKGAYSLHTPYATIGIRGTDHETFVTVKAREGFEPGTFNVVYSGGTTVKSPQGTLNIAPTQAGYVGARALRPKIVKIPQFAKAQLRHRSAAKPRASLGTPKKAQSGSVNKAKKRGSRLTAETMGKINPLGSPKRMLGGVARTPISPLASKSGARSVILKPVSPMIKMGVPMISPSRVPTAPVLTKKFAPMVPATVAPTKLAPLVAPKLQMPSTIKLVPMT
jgi:hypothetical protein